MITTAGTKALGYIVAHSARVDPRSCITAHLRVPRLSGCRRYPTTFYCPRNYDRPFWREADKSTCRIAGSELFRQLDTSRVYTALTQRNHSSPHPLFPRAAGRVLIPLTVSRRF